MFTIRRLILLVSIITILTVTWPSSASSQASNSCQFGELAYIERNVRPDSQEVVVKHFNDFKLEGTLQRILIKQHADGSLDYTLCWTASKPVGSKTPILLGVGALVLIAGSCAFEYWLKKHPSRRTEVDLV